MKLFPSNSRTNLLYTVLLYIAQFAFGFYSNIISASIVDLRFIYHATLNQISYISIPAGLGFLIGSWANYSYRWLNRQLTLLTLLILSAGVIGLLPHYGGVLWCLFGAILVNGIGGGAYESAINVWLVEMWPSDSAAAILQGVSFMYGLGSIASPLVAAPYVHGEANTTADGHNVTDDRRIRDLTVPFGVGAVMQVTVQSAFLALFFINRYKGPSERQTEQQQQQIEQKDGSINNSSSPTEALIPARLAKLALCGVAISTHTSAEIAYMSFSTAMFQYLEIDLSASQSARLQSLLSTASTVGRLVTTAVLVKLVPDLVISYHYLLVFTGLSILWIGRNTLTAIYVGTVVLGYGYSAMTAGLYAFTERHLRYTDRVASFYSFLGALVSLITPAVLGSLFRAAPMVLFALEFGFYAVSAAAFGGLCLWIRLESRPQVKRPLATDNGKQSLSSV